MYTWDMASIRKSILIDVLNTIDRAHKLSLRRVIKEELSMISPEARIQFKELYKIVRTHDDILSSLFYIPKTKENVYRYTVIMLVFNDCTLALDSVRDFIEYIKNSEGSDIRAGILTHCIAAEYRDFIGESDEYLQELLYGITIQPVKYLNSTKLSIEMKFSLLSLVMNYESFIDAFVAYILKVYDAVSKIYAAYKKEFIYSYRLLKDSFSSGNILPIVQPETMRQLGNMERKFIFVLQLICLNYSRVYFEDDKRCI